MDPSRQRTLFEEFLKQAVAEYSYVGGSLLIHAGSAPPSFAGQEPWGHATDDDVKRFERLLGAVTTNNSFDSLTREQNETALNELIRNPAPLRGVLLTQHYEFSKWLIRGQPVDTKSTVMLDYGMGPCISTFLQFQSVDDFHFVQQILSDLNFCKLNEKHLKLDKRRRKPKTL
jgi:hypothetical protein